MGTAIGVDRVRPYCGVINRGVYGRVKGINIAGYRKTWV